MPKPPRNAPCSCGSGKKYKKCCGAPEAAALTWSRADEREALAGLFEFAARPQYAERREAVELVCHGADHDPGDTPDTGLEYVRW